VLLSWVAVAGATFATDRYHLFFSIMQTAIGVLFLLVCCVSVVLWMVHRSRDAKADAVVPLLASSASVEHLSSPQLTGALSSWMCRHCMWSCCYCTLTLEQANYGTLLPSHSGLIRQASTKPSSSVLHLYSQLQYRVWMPRIPCALMFSMRICCLP
jgi:uncharacterized membrane protein YhaH (DUF805 family)